VSIFESIIPAEESYDGTLDVTPFLPGGGAVGIRQFHATDMGRDDISTGKRQFMVTAFYPGRDNPGAPRARLVDLLYPRVDDALELLMRDRGWRVMTNAWLLRNRRRLRCERSGGSNCKAPVFFRC
jgi:hypothetical protein